MRQKAVPLVGKAAEEMISSPIVNTFEGALAARDWRAKLNTFRFPVAEFLLIDKAVKEVEEYLVNYLQSREFKLHGKTVTFFELDKIGGYSFSKATVVDSSGRIVRGGFKLNFYKRQSEISEEDNHLVKINDYKTRSEAELNATSLYAVEIPCKKEAWVVPQHELFLGTLKVGSYSTQWADIDGNPMKPFCTIFGDTIVSHSAYVGYIALLNYRINRIGLAHSIKVNDWASQGVTLFQDLYELQSNVKLKE